MSTTMKTIQTNMDDRMMDDDCFAKPFDMNSLVLQVCTRYRLESKWFKTFVENCHGFPRTEANWAFHVGSCLHPPFERRKYFGGRIIFSSTIPNRDMEMRITRT